ncbi:MAG: dipeptidase PepE [Ginsengibacter sp.]
MVSKTILAFSSSRSGSSGFLEKATPVINQFIGSKRTCLPDRQANIAFFGFADADRKYEEYGLAVQNALKNPDFKINVVLPSNATSVIENSDVMLVGGGNTFKLIHDLQELNLLNLIREKVNNGTSYIGWSAGSNILAPTISTTNDMPIIEPESFKALGLFPFQTNPHYHNQKTEGFNGESRDDRLQEFLKMNHNVPIVGLPEGSYLKLENNFLQYFGEIDGVLFESKISGPPFSKRTVYSGENISYLL